MYFHPEKILCCDVSFIFSTISVSASGVVECLLGIVLGVNGGALIVEVFLKINPSLLNSVINGIIKQTNLVLFNNFEIKRK